jgi:hypothetical protein
VFGATAASTDHRVGPPEVCELSMMTALHLLALVARSTPRQAANWENGGIGLVTLIGVFAAVYWLMFTEQDHSQR